MQPYAELVCNKNGSLLERFNFDEWKILHEKDPDEFEHKRKIYIAQVIARTSSRNQRRLHGILFQVEAIRERSANPLKSCIDISQMMWQYFNQLNDLLNDFDNACLDKKVRSSTQTSSAVILSFKNKQQTT